MSRDDPDTTTESQPELGGMLTPFRGYYRPSSDVRLEAFRSGIFVFDTNALLDLYRFIPDARNEFLGLIRSVNNRVYIPFQVALEFHRNRIDAVAGRTSEFEKQRARLDEIRSQVRGFVRQLAQRAHAEQQGVDELIGTVDLALDSVDDFLGVVTAGYDLDPDNLATSPSDPILRELSEILDGRVGREPSEEIRARDREEGRRRLDLNLPPGFADKRKGDDGTGDYLWWAEVVRYATALKPSAVIIVSNDVRKGDWIYERRGFRVGPDPRLVAEIYESSGADLHWATTSEFLSDIPDALGSEAVSGRTLEEARVSRLLADIVDAIATAVRDSDRPLVSSAVANVALAVDPSLTETAWAGSGSFRSFIDTYLPDLQFVIPPSPGYILDPDLHSESDIPGRVSAESDDDLALDTQGRRDRWTTFPLETLEQLRKASQLQPETLEQLRKASQLQPETLEQLWKATELSPETLDALRRLFE